MNMSEPYYIGELAELTGFSRKTIRYYEREGLLPEPERNSSGYRVYDQSYVDLLQFIDRAKALDLSLSEIEEILLIRRRGVLPCDHVRELLEEKLDELDRRISNLKEFRGEISNYREEIENRSGDPSEEVICPHIENFQREEG